MLHLSLTLTLSQREREHQLGASPGAHVLCERARTARWRSTSYPPILTYWQPSRRSQVPSLEMLASLPRPDGAAVRRTLPAAYPPASGPRRVRGRDTWLPCHSRFRSHRRPYRTARPFVLRHPPAWGVG